MACPSSHACRYTAARLSVCCMYTCRRQRLCHRVRSDARSCLQAKYMLNKLCGLTLLKSGP